MNIIVCSHPGCLSNATMSCRKDPSGKTDEFVYYCAAHAPGLLRGTQAAPGFSPIPHCRTCRCSEHDASVKPGMPSKA
jgi:hypothetical protein